MKRISIVVPFRDPKIKWLNELIKSLNNQTSKKFEVIFVNDNSKERELYKKIILENNFLYYDLNISRPNNINLGAARDFGLKKSNCDFVWFIDADDVIPNYAIEYLIKKIEENEDMDLIFFNFKRLKNESDFNNLNLYSEKEIEEIFFITNETKLKKINKWIFDDFQSEWRKCFKKQFVEKNNVYHSEKIGLFEDIYHDLLMKKYAKKILFTNRVLYFYNRIDNNTLINKFDESKRIFLILNSIMLFMNTFYNVEKESELFLYCMNYYYSFFLRNKYSSLKERFLIYKKYIYKKYKYRNIMKLGLTKKFIGINIFVYVWILFGTTFFYKSYKFS